MVDPNWLIFRLKSADNARESTFEELVRGGILTRPPRERGILQWGYTMGYRNPPACPLHLPASGRKLTISLNPPPPQSPINRSHGFIE